MALPELKSPIARAIAPLLLGTAVIAAMAGVLWLLAAYISDNPDQASDTLVTPEWTVGSVENLSEVIEQDGPLLFRRPGSDDNKRSIVVDHSGDDPTNGWTVYWAYPADRDAGCALEQERGQREFTDCEGRTITIDQLAPPDEGVFPRVDDGTTLVIDFRRASSDATSATVAATTTS